MLAIHSVFARARAPTQRSKVMFRRSKRSSTTTFHPSKFSRCFRWASATRSKSKKSRRCSEASAGSRRARDPAPFHQLPSSYTVRKRAWLGPTGPGQKDSKFALRECRLLVPWELLQDPLHGPPCEAWKSSPGQAPNLLQDAL